MNKRLKISNIILFSIMLFFINLTPLLASSATVSVSSSSNKVVVGNTVTVNIKVKSSSYFGTIEFTPSYDKSKLKLTSGSSSVLWYGKEKQKSFTYKFKAIATGNTTVTVKSVAVRDYSNEGEMKLSKGSSTIKIITQSQLEASYSKNNNLKNLKVDGLKLSPTFNKNTTTYKVEANSNTTSVNVKASVEDSKSRVSGTGKHKVSEGDNKIKVTVTAQNGSTKTYTIIVSVIDPNPIEVLINENKYTIVKRESSLTSPNDFEKTTIEINSQKVPAFYNETNNYTLVGLKDTEGDIELYIYNSEDNTYEKYNEVKLDVFNFFPLKIDKEIDGYNRSIITINDIEVEALSKDNSDFYIIHARDLETGKDNYYTYDKETNTMIRYSSSKEKIIVNNTDEEKIMEYKKMIALLGIETVIIIFVLICILIAKVRKNKRKRKYIEEKIKEEKRKQEELKRLEDEKKLEDKKKKETTKTKKKKTNTKKKEVLKDDKEKKQS